MAHTISPIGPRVVAQAEKAEAKTASGIILPDSAQEKPKTAKVVAVGTKVAGLEVGSRIIYKEYAATEVKLDGEEYLVINAEDILATVK